MDQGNMDKNKEPIEKGTEQSFQSAAPDDLTRIISNLDINKLVSILNRLNKNIPAENIVLKKNDTRIDVLNFLKDFLPQDKKMIIDQVINAFSEKNDMQNNMQNTASHDTPKVSPPDEQQL